MATRAHEHTDFPPDVHTMPMCLNTAEVDHVPLLNPVPLNPVCTSAHRQCGMPPQDPGAFSLPRRAAPRCDARLRRPRYDMPH